MTKKCFTLFKCCPTIQATPGPQGIGLKSITIDPDEPTKAIIEYTDDSTEEIELPTGTGVGIESIELNETGDAFIIIYTDESTEEVPIPAYPEYSLPVIEENELEIEEGMTIDEIVNAIIAYVPKKLLRKKDLLKAALYKLAFNDYVKDEIESGDISMVEGTIILFSEKSYYINGQNITIIEQEIELVDNKINYILLENDVYPDDITEVVYLVETTDIGAEMPDYEDIVIGKLNVVDGIVGEFIQIIPMFPISGSMIENKSITTDKLADGIINFDLLGTINKNNIIIGGATNKGELLSLVKEATGVFDNDYVFLIYDAVTEKTTAKLLGGGDIKHLQSEFDDELFFLMIRQAHIRPEHFLIVDGEGNPLTPQKGDLYISEDTYVEGEGVTRFNVIRHPGVAGMILITTEDGYEWENLIES